MWSLRWWTWTKCYVYVDGRSDRPNEQFCCEDSCSNESSPLLVIVINYCCLLCVVVRIFVSCGPIHVGKCQLFIVKLKNHVWHWMSVFIELLLLGLNSLSLCFRNHGSCIDQYLYFDLIRVVGCSPRNSAYSQIHSCWHCWRCLGRGKSFVKFGFLLFGLGSAQKARSTRMKLEVAFCFF